MLLLLKRVLPALPVCAETGYESQPNGYKQLSESDMRSMWKWTRMPAVWAQPQSISQKHMGGIHQNAPRHNIHIQVQIANQTQFLNLTFKQVFHFCMRGTFLFSPHLFRKSVLDLYQHAAMAHMSVCASRVEASKLANNPLEDRSTSSHLVLSKQHPSKQLFILALPFLRHALSRLVLDSGMQMKNSSRPNASSSITLKYFQPPLQAFCSRLARELSGTTFLTNAQ